EKPAELAGELRVTEALEVEAVEVGDRSEERVVRVLLVGVLEAVVELNEATLLVRAAAAGDHVGNVVVHVSRRIAELVRPEDDGVVVQGAVAVGSRLQAFDQVDDLLRVPALELRELSD